MGKKNKKKQFKSYTKKLKKNNTWQAPPGYKIVVIDRGAASFNMPQDWIIADLDPLEIHDAQPPDDEIRLKVTVFQFGKGINWSALPLPALFAQSLTQETSTKNNLLERSEITSYGRDDIEFLWVEDRFTEQVEKRDAYSRIGIARGFDVHVLITVDFWPEDRERAIRAWDEVLRSLQLGREIDDPTKGVTLH